jgi:hypothetical protein
MMMFDRGAPQPAGGQHQQNLQVDNNYEERAGSGRIQHNTQCRLFQMLKPVNVIGRFIAGGKGAPLQIKLEKIRLSTGDS